MTQDSTIDSELDDILGVPLIARKHPDKYGDPKKNIQKRLIKNLIAQEANKAVVAELEQSRNYLNLAPNGLSYEQEKVLIDRITQLTAEKGHRDV